MVPALLTSTWSDFPSLFRLIKVLLHSSLASMWSFPLWTLPRLPKEKGFALGCKGGEGTRRPFSIHRGMGGWGTA